MATSKRCRQLLCLFYAGLLFVSGALLAAFSAVWGYKLVYHFKFVPNEDVAPFILVFLLAFAHVLLPWLGIRGPRAEHVFHIVLFIVITVVLMLLEAAVAIWTMVLWSKVTDKSLQLMKTSFYGFVKDNYDKSDWIKLQSKLHCCGINNENDYSDIGSSAGSIPLSCCNSSSTSVCPAIFQQGCKEPLIKYVKQLLLEVAAVGFASCVFQILGIVAFYYFYKTLKQEAAARAAARRASRIQEANPLNRRNSRASMKNHPANSNTPGLGSTAA